MGGFQDVCGCYTAHFGMIEGQLSSTGGTPWFNHNRIIGQLRIWVRHMGGLTHMRQFISSLTSGS